MPETSSRYPSEVESHPHSSDLKKQHSRCSGVDSTTELREPRLFFSNCSLTEQKTTLKKFEITYSLILFDYFSSENNINSKIDSFAKKAFKINLPINKVISMHISLISNLERQLRLEGLNCAYLSDFRLTLIDVIAHLGEIYCSEKYGQELGKC